MKRTLPVLVALLLPLAACGGSDSDGSSSPTATSASPSPSGTTPTTPAPPTSSADLVVTPGAIGPIEAGITKAQAVATGVFNADVKGPDCTYALQWKPPFGGVDVATLEDGSVASLGVTEGGPKTSTGVGVGSTLAEVSAAYPNLSPVEEAGFGQAGAYEVAGDDYIGFLFGDATAADIKQKSKVTFMEVTRGDKPGLMRSGC